MDMQQSSGWAQTIEIDGPYGPLAGTLLMPPSPGAHVVLIVPGSGPTDRDGNGPGLASATYRLLAEGLASHGIASVRIDKRGLYGSHRAVPDPNAVTIQDYAADLRAWTAAIRDRMSASAVWVLGHSEGGLVALVAAQTAEDLRGIILVAAPGRPLGTIIRDQLQANPANAPLLEQAFAAIAELEAGRRLDVAGMHPALLPLFRPEVQDYLINAFSFDPAQLIATCRQPVLILQGERDIQVGKGDAYRLQRANASARLVCLPDANHVLKSVACDDLAANVSTYSDPTMPLAPGVMNAIVDFISG
jgi:pimeloyl-ACP methyl ester carboxylesterase